MVEFHDLTDRQVNAALVALVSRSIIENKFPDSERAQRLKSLLTKLDPTIEAEELPEWIRESTRDGAASEVRTVFDNLCERLRLSWHATSRGLFKV
jgi:hypothetical protein